MARADSLLSDRSLFDSIYTLSQQAAAAYLEAEIWPAYVNCLNNMAEAKAKLRSLSEADSLLALSLETGQKELGASHIEVAQTIYVKGLTYLYKGQYEQAVGEYKDALEIRLKNLGEVHPKVAVTNSSIGNAYYFMGDPERALQYCLKSI
jgi:tetratricopeptide (TPR) repeat protein